MNRSNITSHIFSHSFYNIFANFFRFLISSLVIIYLARQLGPAQYGIVSISLSIAVIVGLFCDFGISTSTARFLAEANLNIYNDLYRNGFYLNILLSIIFTFLFLMLSNIIANLINIDSPIYLYAIGGLIFFNATFLYSIRCLQGIKKTDKVAFLTFIQTVVTNLMIFLTVSIGFKALETLWAYSVASLVTWLASLLIIRNFLAISKGKKNFKIAHQIIIYALPLLLTSSLYFLILNGPLLVLSARAGSECVAYLNLPLKMVEVISLPAYSISLVCSPFFISNKGNTNDDKSWLYTKITKYIVLLYVPFSLFLFIFSKDFILTVFGIPYERAVKVLSILSLYLPFFALTNFSGTILDFLGFAKQKSLIFALFTGFAIIASIKLIPIFQEVGAAIAIALPYTLFSFYTIIVSSQKCRINLWTYFLTVLKLVIIIVVALFVAKMSFLSANGLLKLSASFIIFVATFGCLAFFIKIIRLSEVKKIMSILHLQKPYVCNRHN